MRENAFLRLILILVLIWGVGCEVPPPGRQAAYSDIAGLTLADLQADQPPESIENLLAFSILTYVLDADAVGGLEAVFEGLSRENVRYENAQAFAANGFAVGRATHEQGGDLARQLQTIGATRVSRVSMVIPPNTREILSDVDVFGSRALVYSTSSAGVGGATIETGKVGWVIAPQRTDSPQTVQVTLSPAYWRVMGRDLRLLTGQEPYAFNFFDVGRVVVPMQAGQLCLLGPERLITEQDTLNRLLFGEPRRERAQFFVIIFGGLQGIGNE